MKCYGSEHIFLKEKKQKKTSGKDWGASQGSHSLRGCGRGAQGVSATSRNDAAQRWCRCLTAPALDPASRDGPGSPCVETAT